MNKHSFKKISSGSIKITALLATAISPYAVFAAGPPKPSEMNSPLAIILVVVASALLLAIGLLAYTLTGAAQVYIEKIKQSTKENATAFKTLSVIVLIMISSVANAADAPADAAATTATIQSFSGLSPFSFYTLVGIIAVELIVIFALLLNIQKLLAVEKKKIKAAATAGVVTAEGGIEMAEEEQSGWQKFWEKINAFKPASKEADIDLGHNYDGIRELDNNLPPWWLWGFYLTIFIACIYIYRYHIAHTAPNSKQEYEMAVAKAEAEKEEYLKNAKNLVDENTVTYLTEAADIEAGKKAFTTNCAACHGADGGGIVGPNLTDEYWIHGGGIKDIFKTIKYGYQEKGMKSWKDDFSPMQIAQIASFVKSLKGTKPATPKEPQGEIYKEDGAAPATADSAAAKKIAAL